MKKFILGLACGIMVTASTAVYASDAIQAYLFPVRIEINGQEQKMDSEYAVINYNGHAYVPVRFIAEKLGKGIRYMDEIASGKVISIMDEPADTDVTMHQIWNIQYRLEIGNDEKYVRDLLGPAVVEKTSDDFQHAAWRYDMAPVSGYQYNGFAIDSKGMEEDKLKAQLIITWDSESKVDGIELWFKHQPSGKIVMHTVFSDGTTRSAIFE